MQQFVHLQAASAISYVLAYTNFKSVDVLSLLRQADLCVCKIIPRHGSVICCNPWMYKECFMVLLEEWMGSVLNFSITDLNATLGSVTDRV